EVLAALEEIGIDGVILQDLGVWRMIRDHFPALPLHASTQMTVHNAAGVKLLERMGFSRAVLARELSLAEIGVIRGQTRIELEHFVHGALCFGISGQCLFSSYLSGASGNRGRCAQPCRRRYLHHGRPGYYFSTNDFCAIEFLPQLIAAGVISFKIEGRMKSAEYVGRVVAAYRLMLDVPPARRREALAEARELLTLSFGRPASTGFLSGTAAADIAVSSQQGSIGRLLGKIGTVRRDGFSFACNDRLHLGDRVRILPQNDQAGSGFTVTALQVNKRMVKVARAGDYVTVPTAGKSPFQAGDSVYRVSAGGGAFPSEEACRKKLATVRLAPHGVRMQLAVADNALTVTAEGGGVVLRERYPVETFAATKSPLQEEALRRVFAKCGDTSFFLESLIAGELPPVVIPPSRLNEIRRDLYHRLEAALAEAQAHRRRERLTQATASLLPPVAARPLTHPLLTVTVAGPDDLALLDDPDIDELILPLTPTNLQAAAGDTTVRGRLAWELPPIIFEQQWHEYAAMLQQVHALGHRKFRLNNLGHFLFFDGMTDVELTAGARLYTLNSLAALAWRELGAAALTLAIEDDGQNLRELLARDPGIPLTVTVFSPVELLQSRIPIRGVHSGDLLQTAAGEAFQVTTDRGLTILAATAEFSLIGQLRSIAGQGGGNWHLDLSRCGARSARGAAVLAAFRADRELPDTTLFNFGRGLA
ncbi:MAG: DUF3656 domain-containing protein, partial [Desulfobulbaceae bacterium]|nr:DUF3656 domain-containing protein [Desulfobulbaceae bacterium]